MNVIAKLPRHPPARAPDSTRNRAQPSALQLQLDFSAAARSQRNLRNSRTRDFRSSASGIEISVGMNENNSSHRESQRVAHASRVLVSASRRNNLLLNPNTDKTKFAIARTRSPAPRDACATLLPRGSDGLCLWVRGLEAKNCFAFLHQIKPIASDRFEVAHVCLEQGDLASLVRQQILLLTNFLLEVVDLGAALHQFFVRRHEQAHDNKPNGDDQQDEKNAIESLPNGGFATRAEISVAVLHFSGLSRRKRLCHQVLLRSATTDCTSPHGRSGMARPF